MKLFTDTHEWVEVIGSEAVVGITAHAIKEIGEIVFVQLPAIGSHVVLGQEICVLESTKAAIDIYSPISGKVIAINTELHSQITKLNSQPEQAGWLFRLQIANSEELSQLKDEGAYAKMLLVGF